MSLTRCIVDTCRCILDVPEIPYSWRTPDGRCCACAGIDPKDLKAVEIPPTVIAAVKGVTIEPKREGVRAELVKPKAPVPESFDVEHDGAPPSRNEFHGDIALEKGGPPPPPIRARKAGPRQDHGGRSPGPILEALRKMKPPKDDVYSTFLVPCSDEQKKKMRSNISAKMAMDRKKYGSKAKYVSRVEKDGIRIWRIA